MGNIKEVITQYYSDIFISDSKPTLSGVLIFDEIKIVLF